MGRLISVFLLGLAISAGVFFIKFHNDDLKAQEPSVIGAAFQANPIVNGWFPQKEKGWQNKNTQELNLSAKSALVVDYDSGKILYSKSADAKLPAASTIKIMTALVALREASLKDKYTVSNKAANIGENTMGLTEGERLGLEELLYGMMLTSGNDAAVAVVEGVSGNEQNFVKQMNDAVVQMGLTDTKFINASGLDEDGQDQYATAYDLATIAHYTWASYADFRKISSTYEKYLPATPTHKEFMLYNDTNLLTTYPGVKGIKPGFTWNARLCLVTYAENNGKKLLAVILGSEDRRGEMKVLLDYAFAKYGIRVSHPGLDL